MIEDQAYFALGQVASEPGMREASISAMYVLEAEQRYGEVALWAEIAEEQRRVILDSLADCPVALRKLREAL